MKSFLQSAAIAVVLTILVLAWLAFQEGIFDSPDTLDEKAAALDGGVLDQWPFVDAGVADAGVADAGLEDASVPDGGGTTEVEERALSLGLDGSARLSIKNLAIYDKQRRNVLRVKRVRSSMRLGDMQRGIIRVPQGHIEGAQITLYRDETGKISLANAFRTASPSIAPEELPEEPPDGGVWRIEAGPITLKDVRLTLGFTANPVQFRIDRGTMRVRRGSHDAGPSIYFDQIEGAMLKPQPLPRPVRIAFAKGVVRLKGRPMVEMVARTCLGLSELRIHAVVPARKKPVELTANSIGVSSLLGRIVLEAVSAVKSDKVHHRWGVVKVGAGRNCLQPPTRDAPSE
jgi:hypothetical protein